MEAQDHTGMLKCWNVVPQEFDVIEGYEEIQWSERESLRTSCDAFFMYSMHFNI